MDIPAELLHSPPRSTLQWVERQFGLGARVTTVRRLPNAWAAAVHGVDVEDGRGCLHETVLRRWTRTDLPADDRVVENEAATLAMLASIEEVHAPTLIAADPFGVETDVPALLMTRVQGRDELMPPDVNAFLDGLAATLHSIHSIEVEPEDLPRHEPWVLTELTVAPPWARRRSVWWRAVEHARRPVPAHRPVLCHRDFHPGNVLWRHGAVSGVVDWTHACAGPAAADVAHCRLNLAVLFGMDVADEFAYRYGHVEHLAWFDAVDVAGCGDLPLWRWHDAGRTDLTEDTIGERLDAFVRSAVERLG